MFPFARGSMGYYTQLGAPESRALPELPPLPGDGTVGSMSAHWREWRASGAPRLLVQWLRNGVPLRWAGPPPSLSHPKRLTTSTEAREELKKLIVAGAFVPLKHALPSPVFTIPKRTGGVRLIHDLRQVNACLRSPSFTLRGAREAADVVRRSSWLVALDLCHGYQQVAMAPEARQFLGADLGEGETVAATVLPFGLSLSPYIFTRLTGYLARLVRKRVGLEVAVYVDDFLLGGGSEEEVVRGLREVRSLFDRLGVVLSDKVPAVPAQQENFLGFRWDAVAKEVQVPEDRRREYRRDVKNLLRCPQPRVRWRATVGRLLFLREACPTTMRHLRSLLHLIRSRRDGGLLEAAGEAREDLQ